nr:hypothetical protein [uncultured Agathobaculum sp.]
MTKDELTTKLDYAIDDFIETTKAEFGDPYSKEPATIADMCELSLQTVTVLKAFKNAFLEYLG